MANVHQFGQNRLPPKIFERCAAPPTFSLRGFAPHPYLANFGDRYLVKMDAARHSPNGNDRCRSPLSTQQLVRGWRCTKNGPKAALLKIAYKPDAFEKCRVLNVHKKWVYIKRRLMCTQKSGTKRDQKNGTWFDTKLKRRSTQNKNHEARSKTAYFLCAQLSWSVAHVKLGAQKMKLFDSGPDFN